MDLTRCQRSLTRGVVLGVAVGLVVATGVVLSVAVAVVVAVAIVLSVAAVGEGHKFGPLFLTRPKATKSMRFLAPFSFSF